MGGDGGWKGNWGIALCGFTSQHSNCSDLTSRGRGGTGRLSGGHQQTIQGAASNCPAKQIVVRNKNGTKIVHLLTK